MTECYDDFVRQLQQLPDFHRLPLPDSIRERLNIPLTFTSLSIQEATRATFDNCHQYTNSTVEFIQTPADVVFPEIPATTIYPEFQINQSQIDDENQLQPLPSSASPIESNDSMLPESMDSCDSPAQNVD